MWEAEQDEDGDEEGVAGCGGGFGAVAVDGPACEGADDEIEDAEWDEEEAGFCGVEVEELLRFGGDRAVEGAEEGGLDEGDEECCLEGFVGEAVQDWDLADEVRGV